MPPNITVNASADKMPNGNMVLAGFSRKVLEEMKFWMRVEDFDRELAAVQIQEFAEEFDREMLRAVRRRTR
jgi:hypothetical protein